ncbi:MAG: family NAD(P)-dependent oxidoreductase [Sphingomonas bacterium]|uniref:SDR family NAD(P)-dependent oxidoreductase n=1 Tax=Sphingomonas bacterium TaxID=1895847 RepID=UPI0026043357|nr:SDR family oxidoreductase [Sphingomonas bacterium]MDB5704185.1 family NAD(P)-dependent oxidoreductase [Sphingomonas bacterium]
MSGRLAGKAAVVIGAGQTPGDTIGNGRATAILFAREGARVFCVDRDLARAEETAAAIAAEGGEAVAHAADIRDEAACAALIAAARDAFGRIDILHNNVGGGAGDGPVDSIDPDRFDAILHLNLTAMLQTIKHVLPVMRGQGGGAIVNISSLASIAPAGIIAYEISKAGVNKLTTSVAALNARHRIRCNAILPGLIDTPMAIQGWAGMTGEAQAELRAKRNARVPMGRMGTAWDVAHAALWLASDDARFVTGALLPVDGGQSVRLG